MLSKIDLTEYIRSFGVIAIAICAITWWVDLQGWVSACPYCRTERTAIGVLGLIMVCPHMRYLSIFFALVVGFLGAHVASAQVFMHIKNMSFTLMFTGMAASALCILVGQVLLVFDRARRREAESGGSNCRD